MNTVFRALLFFCFSCSLFSTEKCVIWLTGLPCSGKTTIAEEFHSLFPSSVVLDGDEFRKTLNKDLGFSEKDRKENLRRIVEVAKAVLPSADYVIISAVSPKEEFRQAARASFEADGFRFVEVFVDAPLEVCMQRDVKGMYKEALAGNIPAFTGVSAPYEAPVSPNVVCHTDKETIHESAKKIMAAMGVTDPSDPHALFIGRWSPFHKGHWAIMEKVRNENPNRPLLIFVRNNPKEYWPAHVRKAMVENSMKEMNIAARVMIIPDIDSVNWGRDVGYTPRMIDVDIEAQSTSGTDIRRKLAANNDVWKEYVCPGVPEVIENYEKSKK